MVYTPSGTPDNAHRSIIDELSPEIRSETARTYYGRIEGLVPRGMRKDQALTSRMVSAVVEDDLGNELDAEENLSRSACVLAACDRMLGGLRAKHRDRHCRAP